MRHLVLLATAISFLSASSAVAGEGNDAANCTMYSKVGGTMAEFMLPLTVQDLVNMMSGKNPQLLNDMTSNLLSNLDGNDIAAMMSLKQNDAEVAGEAAGEVAMQILMSGQATSSQEVRNYMKQSCDRIGFDVILANQRASRASSAGNLVK